MVQIATASVAQYVACERAANDGHVVSSYRNAVIEHPNVRHHLTDCGVDTSRRASFVDVDATDRRVAGWRC